MKHVSAVMPALVHINRCGANLDLVTVYGVDPSAVQDFRKLNFISGDYSVFMADSADAVVGKALARKRNWKVGEAAEMNGITFNVCGIYENNGSAFESVALVHLPFLQEAKGLGKNSFATQIFVKVDDGRELENVASHIDKYFGVDSIQTDTKPERSFITSGLKTIKGLIDFSQFLGYLSVVIILVLVCNTIYMATQERVQETAVLRTLGFSPLRVGLLVVMESVIISTLGGLIGMALCYGILKSGDYGIGVCGLQVNFRPHLNVQLAGLATAMVIGFLGGFLPALQSSRSNIVDGLRRVF